MKLHVDALAQHAHQLGPQAHGRGLRRMRASRRARHVDGRADRAVLRPRRAGRRLVGGLLSGRLRQRLLIARRARARLPDAGSQRRAGGGRAIPYAGARAVGAIAEPFAVAESFAVAKPFVIAYRRDVQRLTRFDHRALSKRESAERISR
ncbi:hypothetical protein [Burkholderia thailandensis]|uniref:hypothetical protein n=1 Tax=Burkholderia thailandensis TaxID=57975 RepID=UPI00217E9861|nr:hypothetical protein [Burkholderia thailandensis]